MFSVAANYFILDKSTDYFSQVNQSFNLKTPMRCSSADVCTTFSKVIFKKSLSSVNVVRYALFNFHFIYHLIDVAQRR